MEARCEVWREFSRNFFATAYSQHSALSSIRPSANVTHG